MGLKKGTRAEKRKRAESRKDMIVTTIALHRDTHHELLVRALEGRTVLTQLVRDAIDEWLKRNPRKGEKR